LIFAAVIAAALAIPAVSVGQTAGAHFTKNGNPICTDVGTQVRCTAEVAGLGGETVVATVSANGTATGLTCTSPGGNESPGQNPAVPVTAGGSQTINNPKNGRAGVDVTTLEPTVTPKQAGCPNNNWTVTIADVTFTTYTLTISQRGTTLFTCSGSFSPSPSQNGQTSTPTCT
jgi:hypothetical protein